MVMAIVGIQAVTAPAAHAACVVRGAVVEVPNMTVGGTTNDIKGYVNYRACGTYADIIEVSYQIYPGNGDCGFVNDEQGGYRSIDEYRFNMDAIGGWNPLMKTWNCENGRQSYVVWKEAPGVVRVRPGDPANERCIVANATIIVHSDFDRRSTGAAKCINFSN